jgi:LuxR family maltose regulon positive regulatory protein
MGKKISPQNSYISSAMEFNAVFAYIRNGDLFLAEKTLDRVFEQMAAIDLMIKRIYYDKAKALIARLYGRLHRAEAIIIRVLQDLTIQKMQNTPMPFLLQRHLGYIYYLQNRLVEARKCAELTVRYCEYSYLSNEMMGSSELRLLLHLAADEKEQAAECMRQLRAYAAKLGITHFTDGLDACAARIAIDQGDLASAVLWSHRKNLRADTPFSLLFAMESLTQARLYYVQGKYSAVLHLLEPLRNRCIKRNLLELVLQIDILSCAALHGLNRHQAAKSILAKALAFSELKGYVRPFVNDAKYIAPILKDIAEDLYDASFSLFLENVFSACDIPLYHSVPPNGSENFGYEDLTKREIEILEWMAEGFKNKEIAQKASISLSTVKTHVHRILAKLNVPNRTQAIIRIKEMNIMEKG